MKIITRYWVAIAFVTLQFVLARALYGHLPDPVPTHWGVHGQVNGWMPKPLGAYVQALAGALVAVILIAVPRLSPRGFSMASFETIYPTLVAAVTGLLLYVSVVTLLAATGEPVNVLAYVMAGLGVFVAVLGNFMGKVTRNFFVGIRTPWTLASDTNWERTHRFAGRVFVVGGALTLALALAAPQRLVALLVLLAVTFLSPVVYSYVLWRVLEEDATAQS